MDVPFSGGFNVIGGCERGRDLRRSLLEQCHAIYCDTSHYGPVSGGGAAPRSLGIKAVVGTGGTRYRGDMGGGSGGRGGNVIGGPDGRGVRG